MAPRMLCIILHKLCTKFGAFSPELACFPLLIALVMCDHLHFNFFTQFWCCPGSGPSNCCICCCPKQQQAAPTLPGCPLDAKHAQLQPYWLQLRATATHRQHCVVGPIRAASQHADAVRMHTNITTGMHKHSESVRCSEYPVGTIRSASQGVGGHKGHHPTYMHLAGGYATYLGL